MASKSGKFEHDRRHFYHHNHHQSSFKRVEAQTTSQSQNYKHHNNSNNHNHNNNNGNHHHHRSQNSPKKFKSNHQHNSNEDSTGSNFARRNNSTVNRITVKSKLPVHKHKEPFLKLLSENQALVIVGETGSGKTTQIPKWCLEYASKANSACVACTQPRRIAAMSVSARVAAEMNVPLGQEVGYSVRFDQCVSEKTKLKYLTDGMLLREAMLDNLLSKYNVVLLDEAHERTLQTEILLGVIKRALNLRNNSKQLATKHQANNSDDPHNDNQDPTREERKPLPPLKVIIMSATIDVKLFTSYLFDAPILTIEGRQHTVQDMFAEVHQSDLLTSTLITVFQIHRNEDEGDILVFCSGQDEILSLVALCKKVLKQAPETLQHLEPLQLYASLPAKNQMRVFQLPPKSIPSASPKKQINGHSNSNNDSSNSNGILLNSPFSSNGVTLPSSSSSAQPAFMRRVIFATNVAETSVTIPNIKFVIDTGKVKCRTYCPKTGLDSLKVTNISKAQASQRSGRAGRIAPGTCYRLYTDEEHAEFPDHLLPEIKRCNLDGVILQMISIGIKNIGLFDFLEKPEDARIKGALSDLITLKAIKASQSSKNKSSNTPKSKDNASKGGQQISTPSSKSKSEPSNQNHKRDLLNATSNSNDLLNLNYELTQLGKKLCIFPLSPSMSRIILAANDLGCLEEALTIVSLLYIENLFSIPPNKQAQADLAIQKFKSNEGDTIMLLKVFKAFKRTSLFSRSNVKQWCNENFINVKNLRLAQSVRKQLVELCKGMNMKLTSCGHDTSVIRRALTYGLFNNVATMWNGKYRNKYSNEIHIHPSSCLFKLKPECILYMELVDTSKCYMRNCTLIDMNWIREISSSLISTSES